MKLSDLKSLDQVVEDEYSQDEGFRAEWDRTSFAREVANRVVQYRVDNKLSQRDLAKIVDMVQPQIARLEKAEHQPSFETLVKLSRGTGLKFRFEVARGGIELMSA
jgi:ribosome-binding protein aMBF1 (putative translation factor)